MITKKSQQRISLSRICLLRAALVICVMTSDEGTPTASSGEPDQTQRSPKKPKHNDDLEAIPEDMEVQHVGDEPAMPQPTPETGSWASKVNLNANHLEDPDPRPPYSMGEDEEEIFEGIDELFCSPIDVEEQTPKYGPRVEILKEKYISLFRQWRGALILKLLGKSISYRAMEQKLRDLWVLERSFDLTNLEEGYFVVRFLSRDNYLQVFGWWSLDYSWTLPHSDEMATQIYPRQGESYQDIDLGTISQYTF